MWQIHLRPRSRRRARHLLMVSSTCSVSAPQRHSHQVGWAHVLVLGAFDRSGSATIRVRVAGGLGHKEYEATIDTGFSGFVALPTREMVPLGLATEGATTVMLGNGSVIDNLVASASVMVCGQTQAGTVLLDDNSNEILIGMELLREFKLALILTSTAVILCDEREAIDAVLSFMRTAPLGAPNTNSRDEHE